MNKAKAWQCPSLSKSVLGKRDRPTSTMAYKYLHNMDKMVFSTSEPDYATPEKVRVLHKVRISL